MHKSLIFPKEIFSVVIRRSLQGRGSFLIIFANLQICKSAPPPQPSSSQQINAMPFFSPHSSFHPSLLWGFRGRKPNSRFFLYKFCTPLKNSSSVLSSFYRQSRLSQRATLFLESVLPNLLLCGLQRQLGREIHFQVVV